MKVCNVLNELTGEKSELHAELLRIFKDQAQADLAYSKVLGEDFKEVFGDWVNNYKGITEATTGPTMKKGEPKLHNKKGTGQYYYTKLDGTKLFVDRKGLRVSFSPDQINDVSKYFLYRYVAEGGSESFNNKDTTADSSKLLNSIEKSISDYKAQVDGLDADDPDAKYFKDNIEKIDQFKEDWKNELIYQLDSLGQKFKEKITDAEGNPVGEVTEEDKGGGINITESITVNPKNTATVNTKIFLSQVKSMEITEEGYLEEIDSEFLGTPLFEDFSQVWETLQPLLSDQVVTGTGDDISSTYTKMRGIIEGLKDVKPWAYDLADKLDVLYTSDKYKAFEFVQAFNKNKLDYNVTEFDRKTGGYKVINATATNSRESQILMRWGLSFREKWLNNTQIYLSKENKEEIEAIQGDIDVIYEELIDRVNLAGEDTNLLQEAYSEIIPEYFAELRKLGVFGLEDIDINAYTLLTGGVENLSQSTEDLFVGFRYLVNKTITADGHKFSDDEGNYANPFLTESKVKVVAKAMAYRELDIAESTVLGPDGSTYFTYSNPTYINNKINEWKQDPTTLKELLDKSINGNSIWINHLLATDVFDEDKRKLQSQKRLDELQSGIASSFTSVGKNDGVNNVQISLYDQINDNITKLLGSRIKGGISLFPSIIAADKSRRIEFKGLPLQTSLIHDRNGSMEIPPQTTDIFVNYFEDEFNRMMDVETEKTSINNNEKIVHYNTGRMNGAKSQLFPEFSHDETNEEYSELRAVLYNPATNAPITTNGVRGFTESQRSVVRNAVEKTLLSRLDETHQELVKLNDETKINQKLLNSYKAEGGLVAMAGDYMVNGLVSSIEYTKLFSGDPAYYKNLPDLIKRIPSTYTDGLQLALESDDDIKFNVAIVEGVEVASQYQKVIYDSLKDKSIAKAYGNVNTTDAQAWITPQRWKFLKERLGQFTPAHYEVYKKMESGEELEDNEMKLAAQPLKGVYFEINNGVPTYLKYSQAVLIPAMVKGTPMERLLDKMTGPKDSNGKYTTPASDQIHEVITIDGIKVGAIAPTKINEGETTQMAKEFELNSHTLSNKGWKLQQDLPIKTMHETNVGSQIQKNILESLKLNKTYKVTGEEEKIDGQVLLKKIHDAVSSLVNIGREEVDIKLGIKDSKITDKSALYNVIIDEFRSRGGNENIIAALEKETAFDAIPQISGRIDSILMSVFNRAMTKISTEGGSYIQVSPFGYETLGEGSNVKVISDRYDGKGLLPPRRGDDGQTLPGQVMIPHTLALKLLRQSGVNPDEVTDADWKKLFSNEKTRQLVGYRIPNQGMSSNDTLEIVGILPSLMGDSIIGYDGIPAKTGSDFDIDKMYVMAPNLMYNKKESKFEIISEDNKQYYKGSKNTTKLIAQNNLLNLYSDVLQSDHTYDNMMTSIDSGYLKKDIDLLHGDDIQKNLDLFSPITQLRTKMNYMSGKMGVALTANQLVDHVANQSLDILVKTNLGIGKVIPRGRGFVTEMDKPTDDRSIADTLSAFLNAYVDIAKDPYVTRGNHNDITANISFMLIRAGVSMEVLNRYIGQPILKEYVDLKKRADSITAEPITIEVGNENKNATPYEFLRNKYNIKNFGKDDKSHLELAKISNKRFEDRINGADDAFLDSIVLNAFESHEKSATKWTDAVLAAKVDVKGAGGSPVSMHIASNKILKALQMGFVINYESKFIDTALETYKANALDYTSKVLEKSNILLSGTEKSKEFMDTAASQLTKDAMLLNEDLGKALNNSMYSYLMSSSSIMKSNRMNFESLFKRLPEKIIKLKKTSDNFLIKEIQIDPRNGYDFIGINNKDKPTQYQNNIYRAWMDLYETPGTKDLAVNLVRYAYSQSGFQMNLNQFFTYIPHEILRDEGVNAEVDGFFGKINDMPTDGEFLDQFYRHESDNTDVVPRLNESQINSMETGMPYGFTGTEVLKDKYMRNIGKGDPSPEYPLFVSVNIGDKVALFKHKNLSMTNDMLPIYTRTYKLGYKAGKNRVFEYAYNSKLKKSILPENNFEEDFVKNIDAVNIKLTSSDLGEERPNTLEEEFVSEENFKDDVQDIEENTDEYNAFKITPEMLAALQIKKKNCK